MKKNKKGVSLVFVIMAVAALMIFSSMLFTASAHSLRLTSRNTDGRQAYMTARSAIEYTRMKVYDKAKANKLKSFAVGPTEPGHYDDDFMELTSPPWPKDNPDKEKDPDGTTCYAVCNHLTGDDWEILAKVKYRNSERNSERYQTMTYKFTLSPTSHRLMNGFAVTGARYGDYQILNHDGSTGKFDLLPDKVCLYPLAFPQKMVYANSTVTTTAPELYFLKGSKDSACLEITNSTSGLTLSANIIYFNGSINYSVPEMKPFALTNVSRRYSDGSTSFSYTPSLTFAGKYQGYAGIVWFHNTSIFINGTEYKMPDGAYCFKNGTNLADAATLTFKDENKSLLKIDQADFGASSTLLDPAKSDGFTAPEIAERVAYFSGSLDKNGDSNLESSEDSTNGGTAGWTDTGYFRPFLMPFQAQPDKDVDLYLKSGGLDDFNNSTPISLAAHGIDFTFVGTSLTIPTKMTFDVKELYLCGQQTDGYPWKDNTQTTLQAKDGNSTFVVGALDPTKQVILLLPHGLHITGGTTGSFNLAVPLQADLHDPGNYAYTVPSGTDLLNDPDLKDHLKQYTGGGGGYSGGFQISNEQYTDTP